MNEVIYTLNLVDKLKGNSVLDIGARNSNLAIKLKDFGFNEVTLLDKEDLNIEKIDGVNFLKADISNYIFDKTYDIVICRHVLPFTKEPMKVLKKILDTGNICFFTLFGHDDDRKKLSLVDLNEIENTIATNSKVEIIYKNEIHYKGPLYNGDINNWHIFTFVTEKKLKR